MTTLTAHPGDRLLVARHEQAYRVGIVLGVDHADGSPPYRVRWLDDGKEGLVFPGEGARIEPARRTVVDNTASTLRPAAPAP
ncbi:hypothetical protein Athai_15490 [Actinocatenispora thailandica]|uniref:DUF1918 domain-containing protein n=1 Tax=Actinocatenispora thailandica TaxID=227318 RepID=A0A7R7DM09_9ACTN|nr:DUF1918 domain-containing protein [Actinocatenispora thailandica]BCJ34046.1 hypothetical protein Athai_15490 [Actinocatenispora thailandica]